MRGRRYRDLVTLPSSGTSSRPRKLDAKIGNFGSSGFGVGAWFMREFAHTRTWRYSHPLPWLTGPSARARERPQDRNRSATGSPGHGIPCFSPDLQTRRRRVLGARRQVQSRDATWDIRDDESNSTGCSQGCGTRPATRTQERTIMRPCQQRRTHSESQRSEPPTPPRTTS